MLSETEVAELRAKFERAESRNVEGRRGLCIDGPLEGMPVHVAEWVWRKPGACWAFCFPSNKGPVVARYSHAKERDRWRFVGWTAPGRRESGGKVEECEP